MAAVLAGAAADNNPECSTKVLVGHPADHQLSSPNIASTVHLCTIRPRSRKYIWQCYGQDKQYTDIEDPDPDNWKKHRDNCEPQHKGRHCKHGMARTRTQSNGHRRCHPNRERRRMGQDIIYEIVLAKLKT
jgi:hypothetical protein